MNDFVSLNISSDFDKPAIFDILSEEVSFNWRMGESDLQGGYISGVDKNGIQIKIWIDENPMEFSMSFRGAAIDSSEKEKIRETFVNNLVPKIGTVTDVKIY